MFECVGCVFLPLISVAVCSIVFRFCMCVAQVPRNSSVKFGSDWLREKREKNTQNPHTQTHTFPQPIRTKLYTRIPWHLSKTPTKSEDYIKNSYRVTGKKHTTHTLKSTLSFNQSKPNFILEILGTSATHVQNLRTILQTAIEIHETHSIH